MKSLSHVQLFETPWTVVFQAPPSMGFSRQEYWSGLPFPSPRDLPNRGIEPRSPALQADAFYHLSYQGSLYIAMELKNLKYNIATSLSNDTLKLNISFIKIKGEKFYFEYHHCISEIIGTSWFLFLIL